MEGKKETAVPASAAAQAGRRGRPPAANVATRIFLGSADKDKVTLSKEVTIKEARRESYKTGKPFFKVQAWVADVEDTKDGKEQIVEKPYEGQ